MSKNRRPGKGAAPGATPPRRRRRMRAPEMQPDMISGMEVYWETEALYVLREQAAMSGVTLDTPLAEFTIATLRDVLDRKDICERSAVLKRHGKTEQFLILTTTRALVANAESLAEFFVRVERRLRDAAARFPNGIEIRSKTP